MKSSELKNKYKQKKRIIVDRLKDFKKSDLFYELCFCLLTPQSSAFKADNVIQQLIKLDFKNKKVNPKPILKKNIRFHNNKTKYLLEMKKNYSNISKELSKIKSSGEKRNYLVKNVKGLGLKEASHYLRNTGHKNLAILDRHILKNLVKLNAIKMPNSLTPKKYFEIENDFMKFSNKVKIPMDHLDLLFWSMETGEVFK